MKILCILNTNSVAKTWAVLNFFFLLCFQVEPVLVVVDEFDKWTLQEKVCNISIGKVDNKCVYRILPSKEDVRTIEEQTRGTKKGM